MRQHVSIQVCELPADSLIQSYKIAGDYTDCFATDLVGEISLKQYVHAFYTSWAFKAERAFLAIAILKASSDAQAAELAEGLRNTFSAWSEEKRSVNQLLMCDYQKKTRSWLMVAPMVVDNRPGTRLYFGSVVVAAIREANHAPKLSFGFRALLGFHKIYSRVLLRAAAARCLRNRRPAN